MTAASPWVQVFILRLWVIACFIALTIRAVSFSFSFFFWPLVQYTAARMGNDVEKNWKMSQARFELVLLNLPEQV